MKMVKAVVGANWGDEGKGKITDMLAQQADIIVRFQGGANAGHTIINDYGKFALHTLPSGVFYSHTTSIIGNGVALDVPVLFQEIQSIIDKDVPMPKILVSDRAQMVCLIIRTLTLMKRKDWEESPLALPSPALRPSIPTSTPRLASRSAICSMTRIPSWSASTTCWG